MLTPWNAVTIEGKGQRGISLYLLPFSLRTFFFEARIRYGPFRVEVLILSPIDCDNIKAHYENGFLWVDLPELPENKSERVRIEHNSVNP
jgi:hypothetical protein